MQPWARSVSDLIFCASAYKSVWPVVSFTLPYPPTDSVWSVYSFTLTD